MAKKEESEITDVTKPFVLNLRALPHWVVNSDKFARAYKAVKETIDTENIVHKSQNRPQTAVVTEAAVKARYIQLSGRILKAGEKIKRIQGRVQIEKPKPAEELSADNENNDEQA